MAYDLVVKKACLDLVTALLYGLRQVFSRQYDMINIRVRLLRSGRLGFLGLPRASYLSLGKLLCCVSVSHL